MLILPFVENSVKHSSGSLNERAEVYINMAVKDKQFFLVVTNNIPFSSNAAETGGIGLQNVKKRLEILYEKNYKLDIKKETGNFSIQLELSL